MPVKRLADLQPGDVFMTNEGRPEWRRIINISDPEIGEPRYALVEHFGGRRRGWRFPMDLHDYDKGWTVRT